jgi:hypothetical protein
MQGEDYDSRGASLVTNPALARIAPGFIGGLLATIAIDLVVIGIFPLMAIPADVSFSVIGDTAAGFFDLVGITVAGGVALGVLVHYLTGISLGVLLGWALSYNNTFHVDSIKKGAAVGILYTEVISLPLLALPPIVLNMPASGAAQWFGVSLIMHSLYGAVLGAVVGYGLQR